MSVQVPKGYKQTEVGVIPEDWPVKKLSELASFRTGPFGSALHKSDYITNGVPVINPMHIIDGQINPSEDMTITEDTAKKLSEFRLTSGEVVIGRRGDMGRCAVVRKENDGWLCGTGSMIVRPKNHINPQFLQRVLASPSVIAAIEETSVGSTMINLNQSTLGGLWIQAPSAAEQQAIAEALSDADALIESLEQLIAKKRQIKQGAMQELLTGQRRLPGFSGEWIPKRLGDAATLKARIGWQGLKTDEYLEHGDFALVTGTEFKNGKIVWNECYFVDEARYKQDKNIQLKENDILVTKDGTIGKVALVSDLLYPATLNSGVFVIRPKQDEFNQKFFFYMLQSSIFKKFLDQLSAGSTINHLYQKDFVNFIFYLPPTLDEQYEISDFLESLDAEIGMLDVRLLQTRQIKQSMMQELLTGRIRLI